MGASGHIQCCCSPFSLDQYWAHENWCESDSSWFFSTARVYDTGMPERVTCYVLHSNGFYLVTAAAFEWTLPLRDYLVDTYGYSEAAAAALLISKWDADKITVHVFSSPTESYLGPSAYTCASGPAPSPSCPGIDLRTPMSGYYWGAYGITDEGTFERDYTERIAYIAEELTGNPIITCDEWTYKEYFGGMGDYQIIYNQIFIRVIIAE